MSRRRLTAIWNVNLQQRLWVTRPLQKIVPDPIFSTIFNDFEVYARLFLEEFPSQESPSRGITIRPTTRIEIRVTRSESTDIPSLVPVPAGGEEAFQIWAKAHGERNQTYTAAALEILNRLLMFFRFGLRTPLIEPFTIFGLPEPKWLDESGELLEPGLQQLAAVWGPPAYLTNTLHPEADSNLKYCLDNPVEPTLVEEILLDAMGALKQGNIRRAVIEAAVCAEVATRDAFSFDYLDERGEHQTTVIDLLSRVARSVSGFGFDSFDPASFNHIRLLFLTRNKGAHEGKPYYKEADGTMQTVTRQKAAEWIRSVEVLLFWLEQSRQ